MIPLGNSVSFQCFFRIIIFGKWLYPEMFNSRSEYMFFNIILKKQNQKRYGIFNQKWCVLCNTNWIKRYNKVRW